MTRHNPAEWASHIDAWCLSLRTAGRPETTIGLRRYHLTRLAGVFGGSPWDVTCDDLTAWLGGQRWRPETRRSWRASLRGFYGWAVETGRASRNPVAALQPVKPSQPRPHPTPEDMWREALAKADPRALLMIRLAGLCGLRRGEVAQVHARDLERDLTGWSLLVHGKGARERLVPLPDALAAELRLACGAGYAFPGAINGHLSPARVGRIVSRLLPDGWSMHSLRHRFGTRAYAVDHDLLVVQALLGHASPVTTRVYVEIPNAALRRTVLAAA